MIVGVGLVSDESGVSGGRVTAQRALKPWTNIGGRIEKRRVWKDSVYDLSIDVLILTAFVKLRQF